LRLSSTIEAMKLSRNDTTYEISWTSIFRVLTVILFIWLLLSISDALLVLFTVIVLTVSLSPIVDKIKNKLHLPRILAIVLIFVVILAFVSLTVYIIIPPLVEQFRTLYQTLPENAKKAIPLLKSINMSGYGSATNGSSTGNLSQTVGVFLGNILDMVFILVLTFLLLIEEGGFVKYMISLFPVSDKAYAITVGKKISNKIGGWFAGQILIMVIMGLVNFLAYLVVGIPYALVLGIFAFIFEVVPNLGPIIAAVPALILAYISAPWKAAYVLVFVIVIHQISNQFLVPKVMGKILNMSAFVIILGLIIGGELAGITGMILALPVVAALQVITQEWPNIKTRIPKNEIKDLRN